MASTNSSERAAVNVGVDLRILDRRGMERSGIGRYALESLAAMRAARPSWRWTVHGNRPDLVAPGPDLELRRTRIPTASALGRIAWLELRAGTQRPPPDVWLSPASVLPGRWRGPSVITIHDVVFAAHPELYRGRSNAFYAARAIRRSARRATRVICPSTATAERAHELLGVDESKLVVSRWGVADVFRGPKPGSRPEQADSYLLFVGRWEARKGLEILAQALRSINQGGERVALKLAGGPGWGTDRTVRELLATAGVEAVVDPTDEQLVSLYDGALALVYPSRMEGFGLPVAEAMARGCPVIASDLPELREWALEVPLYVPAGDPGALAEAVTRVATDAAMRARMASQGAELAADLGWERVAEDTTSAIDAALGQSRAGPATSA